MNQSGDGTTSGKTDCSEAMEANGLQAFRTFMNQRLAEESDQFLGGFGDGSEIERVKHVLNELDSFQKLAMADDAVNRAVQKTHPSNCNSLEEIKDSVRVEFDLLLRSRLCDIDARVQSLRVMVVEFLEIVAQRGNCDGRAEGHNTVQAHDGR